ncbi:hypothetical protein D3OALGA1CA_4638 [Olavius algarvensis associated proteobacterium Delta 3]|nr:hypothetical protein D3OALGB2SA_4827 [Olavius algarvensis associated proteobacterium Delta 3]CAB5154567.1 hypothetical protein D3OALGA1CA_4638 [Olavius algarvensis associated proteobacterium Delta 3]
MKQVGKKTKVGETNCGIHFSAIGIGFPTVRVNKYNIESLF